MEHVITGFLVVIFLRMVSPTLRREIAWFFGLDLLAVWAKNKFTKRDLDFDETWIDKS